MPKWLTKKGFYLEIKRTIKVEQPFYPEREWKKGWRIYSNKAKNNEPEICFQLKKKNKSTKGRF